MTASKPISSDFALEVAKHLLRGRFARVGELRSTRSTEFNQLPSELLTVARQWTGQGRGDAQGRRQITNFLQTNFTNR